MFSVFDNVYILSAGQCVYQGYGPEVIPYLSDLGLECPKNFNPADFSKKYTYDLLNKRYWKHFIWFLVIEIACQEYGNYQDKLVSAIDNGRCYYSQQKVSSLLEVKKDEYEISAQNVDFLMKKSSWIMQFSILLARMWKQMWRDKVPVRETGITNF